MSGGAQSTFLGQWGEELAAQYLRKKGYCLIASRWRCRLGEIDLIVQNSSFLVFVEVKLRKNSAVACASEFVDYRKQKKLRAAASLYLSWNQTSLQPRFDVMEIYVPEGTKTVVPEIHHIENAFW